jgi:hypothetical protein
VLHSFIDELISPEKFAQHIKDKHEVSILNPTFITELEDGVTRDEDSGMAIRVDGITSKSYATVNGINTRLTHWKTRETFTVNNTLNHSPPCLPDKGKQQTVPQIPFHTKAP